MYAPRSLPAAACPVLFTCQTCVHYEPGTSSLVQTKSADAGRGDIIASATRQTNIARLVNAMIPRSMVGVPLRHPARSSPDEVPNQQHRADDLPSDVHPAVQLQRELVQRRGDHQDPQPRNLERPEQPALPDA